MQGWQFSLLLSLDLATGVLIFIGRNWIKARIEQSVRSGFEAKLEALRSDLRRSEEGLKSELRTREAQIKGELDRDTNIKIETLKSDNSTLQSSVDLLLANQSEIRARRLVAVEKMWNVLLQMNDKFSGVVHLDTILLPEELDEFFGRRRPLPDYIQAIVNQYAKEDASFNIFEEIGTMDIEKERPFLGEQMWVIFYVLRAIYGRCAMLISTSIKKTKFQNWKEDKHLASIVGMVLPQQVMDTAKAMRGQGLQSLILHLNRAFLEEADKVLSGAKTTQSLLPNYQAMLMEERDKITAYRQV
jgi:hypothetical protein